MQKNFFTLFALLALSLSVTAVRAQSVSWAVGDTTDTDYGYSFHPSTGSTAIVAGKSASFQPFPDFLYSDGLLTKVDILTGAAAWTKTYHLAVPNVDNINYDKSDIFWRTRLTADGGSITVGASGDTLGLPSLGLTILKTDANGVPQWSKFIAGNGFANAAYDVQVLPDGYVLCGTLLPAAATQGIDAAMAKFDLNGDVLWSKNIGTTGTQSSRAMARMSDGGFMLAGASVPQGGNSTTTDILVVKTNANGTVQWAKTYGNPADEDRATAIISTGNGAIVGGFYKNGSGLGMEDMFVMMIDGTGTVLWKTLLGTANTDYLNGLTDGGDGSIIATGYYTVAGNDKNAVMARFDIMTGALLSAKQYGYGTEDVFFEAIAPVAGRVIAFGNTGAFDNKNDILVNQSNVTSSNNCNGTPWNAVATLPQPFATAAIAVTSNVAGVVKEFPFTATLVSFSGHDICTPVATEKGENTLVASIAPNPNSGQFTITVANATQISLTNSIGQVVLQQNIAAGNTEISTQNLANGIYFLHLKDERNRTATQKIVVNF